MGRHFDEAFRLLGLTHGQFSLLMSLNRPAPAGMKDVADLLARERRRTREVRRSARLLRQPGSRAGRGTGLDRRHSCRKPGSNVGSFACGDFARYEVLTPTKVLRPEVR
jgi:hypothetical protein